MRKIIPFLIILSCYHYKYRDRKDNTFKSYICAKEGNLIQVTSKGFPFKKRFISNISKMESEIKLITYPKRVMKLLALKNARNKVTKRIKNIVYELRIGTLKLNNYLKSSYLKHEIDKLISLNTEIVRRKWNDKYECELTMSLDISLIDNIIKDKIIKKYDNR